MFYAENYKPDAELYADVYRAVDTIRTQRDWIGNTPGSPVLTRYPNLAVEIYANLTKISISSVCACANVSLEVLAGVLENGDELTSWEMIEIARLYNCNADYLRSPVLSTVNPQKGRGRLRLQVLEEVQYLAPRTFYKYKWCLFTLRRGLPVAFAWYRRTMQSTAEESIPTQEAPIRTKPYRGDTIISLDGGLVQKVVA